MLRLDPVNGAFAAEASVADAVLSGPATGIAYDLGGGRISGEVRLAGAGRSPVTMLAALKGEGRLVATEGVLVGFDLSQAADALQAPVPRPRSAHIMSGAFP